MDRTNPPIPKAMDDNFRMRPAATAGPVQSGFSNTDATIVVARRRYLAWSASCSGGRVRKKPCQRIFRQLLRDRSCSYGRYAALSISGIDLKPGLAKK